MYAAVFISFGIAAFVAIVYVVRRRSRKNRPLEQIVTSLASVVEADLAALEADIAAEQLSRSANLIAKGAVDQAQSVQAAAGDVSALSGGIGEVSELGSDPIAAIRQTSEDSRRSSASVTETATAMARLGGKCRAR